MSPKRRLNAGDQRPPVTSPYLTSEEAIVYLRLQDHQSPYSALYRLITEWRMPNCRVGRLYRFDTRELDAWMRGHESALAMVRARKAS
jgi:excisionase family DNA binding protein